MFNVSFNCLSIRSIHWNTYWLYVWIRVLLVIYTCYWFKASWKRINYTPNTNITVIIYVVHIYSLQSVFYYYEIWDQKSIFSICKNDYARTGNLKRHHIKVNKKRRKEWNILTWITFVFGEISFFHLTNSIFKMKRHMSNRKETGCSLKTVSHSRE